MTYVLDRSRRARSLPGVSATEKTFLPALRFKALTPLFDTVVRVTSRETTFKRRLLDQLALPPAAHVLDVGAGTGTLAVEIARRWPDARVTGLDAHAEILAIARRKAGEANSDVEFVEGFSTELPFPDAHFDAVTATLFFHHLDGAAKRATLREIARTLKRGGTLHVADWGRPADPLQAATFVATVRAFDGFEVTADNARGALPDLIAGAGLRSVAVRDRLRTALGTLDLIRAER